MCVSVNESVCAIDVCVCVYERACGRKPMLKIQSEKRETDRDRKKEKKKECPRQAQLRADILLSPLRMMREKDVYSQWCEKA